MVSGERLHNSEYSEYSEYSENSENTFPFSPSRFSIPFYLPLRESRGGVYPICKSKPLHPSRQSRHVASKLPVYHGSATSPGREV